MSRYIDLTGQRFGKLLALELKRVEGKSEIFFRCLCDCGNETLVRSNALRDERSKSCGCNLNQSAVLKFKKENPHASYEEIVKERLKAHSKWVGECLEWTATTSNGYGVFVLNKKTINASRAAWIAEHGEIPKGLCVLHNCPNGDNRKCINTKHMFLGTHAENTADMIKKGRDSWQTCRKFPVGTREKVGEMRDSGKLYREIAEELGLTMDMVKSLLQRHKVIKKRIDKDKQ